MNYLRTSLAALVLVGVVFLNVSSAHGQYAPAPCYTTPGVVLQAPVVPAPGIPATASQPFEGARYAFYTPTLPSTSYYSPGTVVPTYSVPRYYNPGPYYYTPTYSYTPGYYSYYYTPGYFRY